MMSFITKLTRLFHPYRWIILLAVLMSVITISSSIALMMTSAFIISKAALHPSISEIQVAIVGVRLFGISRGVFRYYERLLTHKINFKILVGIRQWFYAHIEKRFPFKLPKLNSSDLLTRMVADIESLDHFFIRFLVPVLTSLIIGTGIFFVLLKFHIYIALSVLVFFIVAGYMIPLLSYMFMHSIGEKLINIRKKLNARSLEFIEGFTDIHNYGRSRDYENTILRLQTDYEYLLLKMKNARAFQDALVKFLLFVTIAVTLYLGAGQVQAGMYDGIYLAVIVMGLMASVEAILPVPAAFQYLGNTEEAAKRIFSLVESQSETEENKTETIIDTFSKITLKNISYTYPGTTSPALENIDLSLEPGDRILLIGENGAGKTTLIYLLLDFLQTSTGTVSFNGQDYSQMTESDIRTQFSAMEQSTYLFNDTLAENLKIAKPEAGDDELIRALKMAELDNFVAALPKELHTYIGDKGMELSGGERQRLALARTFLKDSDIMIFDEPGSHLDSLTEEKIFNTILNLPPEKCVIVISHKLIRPGDFTKCLHLSEGKIKVYNENY